MQSKIDIDYKLKYKIMSDVLGLLKFIDIKNNLFIKLS